MIEFLSNLDTQLFLALNSLHMPALDRFMLLVSHKYVWVPFYAVFAVLLIRRFGWKTGVAMLLGAALTIALADQICATYIRPYVARLRPANPDNPLSQLVHTVGGYRGGSYGFPSCHAANTFAFTVFMSLVLNRRRSIVVILLTWALLNCWSRIYLGVHYPGDLLCGALVGSVCGFVVFFTMQWTIERFFNTSVRKSETTLFNLGVGSDMGLTVGHASLLASVELATMAVLLSVSLVSYALI